MAESFDRDRHLDASIRRSAPWDLIIIGGGASGVGAALDATTRGLSVLLLERSDFGKGTSSRSTKLIHGGVRYLEQGNIALVRESLRERTQLLRNAPHLVHPLEFIIPCRSRWQVFYYGLGMIVYDWLASSPEFHRSTRLAKHTVLAKAAALWPTNVWGGISYFDGQFDDSRLLINLVQTAAENGATLVNGASVIELIKNDLGRIDGLCFRDEETGQVHRVRGRCILNATGPFCDSIRKLDRADVAPLVAASQGIHLVLPKKFFPGETALIVPKTRDGRVMFIIPWHNHVLLGTTDTPIQAACEEPTAFQEEVDFLLSTAAEYLHNPPNRRDCLSVFAGIRPLVRANKSSSTASLSRDHTIEISPNGLMTITGGKWTTYRQMAEDCIDQVIQQLGIPHRPSATLNLRLHGCVASQSSCEANSYGTDETLIGQLILQNPSLAVHLHVELPIRAADVVWSVRHEWARSVEDVLARRTRALFLNARASIQMAPAVAKLMAGELNRDEDWQTQQIEAFEKTAKQYVLN
jgi:glycerol-3-phosphate dehydrogenase